MSKVYTHKQPTRVWRTLSFLVAGPFNPAVILFILILPRSHFNSSGEIVFWSEFGLAILLSVCATVAMLLVLYMTRDLPILESRLRRVFVKSSMIIVCVMTVVSTLFAYLGCNQSNCEANAVGFMGLSFLVGSVVALIFGSVAYFVFKLLSLQSMDQIFDSDNVDIDL